MNYYTERLNSELYKILNYWNKYAIVGNKLAPEIDIEGIPNFKAPLGTIYISRILYGSSAAMIHLDDKSYLTLAELAYHTLTTQLRNPKGGYFWGINADGTILHDEMHVSFAQPFVLYGLGEYYALAKDEQVAILIKEQVDFIEKKLTDKHEDGYLDGFTYSWNASEKQFKSLGTHLHLLEAYTKLSRVLKDTQFNVYVENLASIILKHFINLKVTRAIHQFDRHWAPQPDENWIGHNVESSWILCDAAATLKNKELQVKCKEVALHLCDVAIETGFDSQYGGMFNRFDKGNLLSTDKEWWPQAESAIAFLNAYSISGNKKYLSYAIRLLEYIDNTFSDSIIGEWYDSVSREGKPYLDKPKAHFWKSMYHNVRYCILTNGYLEKLFSKSYSFN
jgi:cellobiose epimerase